MDPLNNLEDEAGLHANEQGNVRQRQVPANARAHQDQWQNVNGLREYMGYGREIVGYQLAQQVNQSVLGIVKAIIVLLLFMGMCFIFGYESIPRMIAVLFMIAAGLRYCWRRWYGENINGINVNML